MKNQKALMISAATIVAVIIAYKIYKYYNPCGCSKTIETDGQ